jgi:hypothetical protein
MKAAVRAGFLICLMVLLAWSGFASDREERNPTKTPGVLTPQPPKRFEAGPALLPKAALLDWLARQGAPDGGPKPWLRVPVWIHFKDAHRLAIKEARLAAREGQADTLRLSLDDSAMGISLMDQLRQLCPSSATGCGVWLEGTWGKLLPLGPEPDASQVDVWTLAVRRVHALIAPEEAATARVFVEAR